MTIRSLAHVCLKSKNLAATEAFYCQTLRLPKFFSFTKDGREIGFYLRINDQNFIEVFLDPAATSPSQNHALSHLCLEVDDIEGARKRVINDDYVATEIKKGCDESYQFWVKDPDGVDVEFHQYTPTSSQFTGRSVEIDW